MANKPSKTLNAHINQLVARASGEISALIRHELAAEVQRHTPAAAKALGKKRARKSGPNAITLDKIVAVIRATPGLRNEQIQKELALPGDQVKAALAKLRSTGTVQTKGARRAMTYSAA